MFSGTISAVKSVCLCKSGRETMEMQMVLKRNWDAINAGTGEKTMIPKGTHEIERFFHPEYKCYWFVLKGTLIGASEASWRQRKNGELSCNPDHPDFGKPIDWKESEVVILNDDTPVVGFVIQHLDGNTLDRNLYWSTNTMRSNGYVHTQDSLKVVRVLYLKWDEKPAYLYPATYLNGQVEIGERLFFNSLNEDEFIQLRPAPNADIVWPTMTEGEFVVLDARMFNDHRYIRCANLAEAKEAIKQTLFTTLSQTFNVCKAV